MNLLGSKSTVKDDSVHSRDIGIDIIEVLDDDDADDIGVPIPRAGTNSKPDKMLPSTSRIMRQRSDSPDPINAWPAGIHPDGPSTVLLLDKFRYRLSPPSPPSPPMEAKTRLPTISKASDPVTVYSSDPIEDASTFDDDIKPKESSHAKKSSGGFVRKRIQAIETKQQAIEAKEPIKVPNPHLFGVREVDLVAEAKKAAKASTVKNAMKPKSSSRVGDTRLLRFACLFIFTC